MNYEIYFNCYILSNISANMSVINNIGTEDCYIKHPYWIHYTIGGVTTIIMALGVSM